jgi:hypothetical protein
MSRSGRRTAIWNSSDGRKRPPCVELSDCSSRTPHCAVSWRIDAADADWHVRAGGIGRTGGIHRSGWGRRKFSVYSATVQWAAFTQDILN